jgi:predicted ATPase
MATPILKKLSVQNFRAIGPNSLDIDLAPLTVLVGENGSGKSSLLQALAVTAQSAIEDPRRSDLILDGGTITLGIPEGRDYRESYREIYFRKDPDQPLSVYFETSVHPKEWPSAASKPPAAISPDKDPLFAAWPPDRVGYRWTRTGLKWPVFSHEFTASGRSLLKVESTFDEFDDRSGTPHTIWTALASEDQMNRRETGFRSPDRVLSEDFLRLRVADLIPNAAEQLYGYAQAIIEPIRASTTILRSRLASLSLVEPLRGRQLVHRDVGPDVSFVGPHGEMLVRFLSLIRNRTSPRYETFRRWADQFGVRGIETGTGGSNELKIAFRDPATGTALELHEAATGSFQAVLMAAQVLLSAPGSVLLYEEPENNLHPKYERLLPALYSDAIRSDHQVIVTTHSEVLVAAIGNEVRKGTLSDTDVAVWETSRSPEASAARRIHVSDRGYLEGWVHSFAQVEEEMFDEWTKALPPEGERGRRGHTSSRRGGGSAKERRRRSR